MQSVIKQNDCNMIMVLWEEMYVLFCEKYTRITSYLSISCTIFESPMLFKINPFTLRAPLEPNVCYFHTFENNLRTKRKLTTFLNESCSLASNKHFSFKSFPENAFVSKIFPNLSGLFWLL